jgi:deoxyribose-phosphate aldolase
MNCFLMRSISLFAMMNEVRTTGGGIILNQQYAAYIDHTLLKADATKEEIIQLCEEAKTYSFASVCVNPAWVNTAAEVLKGSSVKVCTVIGFPLGASTSAVKAFETKDAIENGAGEIDMVINIGALRSGDDELVKNDIAAVVESAKGKAIVKVIIETSLLTEQEKRKACELSRAAGADFVKTSTGFSTGGATEADVKLMRAVVGPEMGVKASGGVRSFDDMKKMIDAGATRIGASSGVQIMQGLEGNTAY